MGVVTISCSIITITTIIIIIHTYVIMIDIIITDAIVIDTTIGIFILIITTIITICRQPVAFCRLFVARLVRRQFLLHFVFFFFLSRGLLSRLVAFVAYLSPICRLFVAAQVRRQMICRRHHTATTTIV